MFFAVLLWCCCCLVTVLSYGAGARTIDSNVGTGKESLASTSTIRYTMSGFMELCRRTCFIHDRRDCIAISCRCVSYGADIQVQREYELRDEPLLDDDDNDVDLYSATEQGHPKHSKFLERCLQWCQKADKESCVDGKCYCTRKDLD